MVRSMKKTLALFLAPIVLSLAAVGVVAGIVCGAVTYGWHKSEDLAEWLQS